MKNQISGKTKLQRKSTQDGDFIEFKTAERCFNWKLTDLNRMRD